MSYAHYSPTKDPHTYRMFNVMAHHRGKAFKGFPSMLIPIGAIDKEMAARVCRERYPHMLVVNIREA
jgi:hypothetical protein